MFNWVSNISERVRKKNGVRPNITNITVYLDREDAKKLGQLAKEQGLPGKSTLTRQLIKHYLKRHSSWTQPKRFNHKSRKRIEVRRDMEYSLSNFKNLSLTQTLFKRRFNDKKNHEKKDSNTIYVTDLLYCPLKPRGIMTNTRLVHEKHFYALLNNALQPLPKSASIGLSIL